MNRKFLINKVNSSLTNLNLKLNIDFCNSLDCFYNEVKKLNNYSNSKNVYLLKETIDFRFEFFKNVANIKIEKNLNLNKNEIYFLKKFIRDRPFKITDCDKNVGICIMSNEIYNELILNQLSNISTYVKIDNIIKDTISEEITNQLHDLYLNGHISKKLFSKLSCEQNSFGKFRILPKLHKENFSVRPIINCKMHFTSNLCLLIDLLLKPFVKNMPSYIQDSQQLIQETTNLKLVDNVKLFSCDFESLYSNIILSDCLNTICEYMQNKINSTEIDIIGFRCILKIIFEFNYFKYKDIVYKQIKGIAMGSKCGPSIANIYISCLEKTFLQIYRPIFYKRFIDDIFLITSIDFNIDYLKNNFLNLKLNVDCGLEVVFLDLRIKICKICNILKFSLYVKPTNTFSYLKTNSNHPNYIFSNIVKTLFIRIRRICTDFSNYLYFSRLLTSQLLNRGFDFDKIRKISNLIGKVDRNCLIPYKNKNLNYLDNCIFFKIPFEKNLIDIDKILKNCFLSISTNSEFLKDMRFKTIFMKNPNISSIFVHHTTSFNFEKYSYSKCDNINCLICKFSHFHLYFLLLNQFYLPIYCNSNCSEKNCVYILHCTLCDCYYIGQTVNFRSRFQSHISNIRNFVPYKKFSSVSNHFNLLNHSHEKHLKFYIIQNNLNSLDQRLNFENDLINLFLCLKIKIMNYFIPNKYYIKILKE